MDLERGFLRMERGWRKGGEAVMGIGMRGEYTNSFDLGALKTFIRLTLSCRGIQ